MFEALYEAIAIRSEDLSGKVTEASVCRELRRLSSGHDVENLLHMYTRFSIAGVMLSFRFDGEGRAHSWNIDAGMDDYDSSRDHSIVWMGPNQIVEFYNQAYHGASVLERGFLVMFSCALGGDDYFINLGIDNSKHTSLFQLYHDWLDPDSEEPVPRQAIHRVTDRFEDVIMKCRIDRS